MFDVKAHIHGAQVFRADEKMEVKVRYSLVVALWIAKKETGDALNENSIPLGAE